LFVDDGVLHEVLVAKLRVDHFNLGVNRVMALSLVGTAPYFGTVERFDFG